MQLGSLSSASSYHKQLLRCRGLLRCSKRHQVWLAAAPQRLLLSSAAALRVAVSVFNQAWVLKRGFWLACRSWDEERSSLMSQIEALRKEARLYATTGNKANGAGSLAGDGSGGGASGPGGADGEGGEGSPQSQLAALKKALDEAKENEVGARVLLGWSRAPEVLQEHCRGACIPCEKGPQ